MREEIIGKLRQFQEAYDRKEVEFLDDFMNELFVKDEFITIIGTSNGELCLGYDACKTLFKDDFLYWSFEQLDFEKIVLKGYDDLIVVYAPATFSFTFSNSEINYGNYLNNLIENLDKTIDQRDPNLKLAEINWILAHFLHNRPTNDRKYLFDLRLCFIFKKCDPDYRVKQIQFSVTEAMNHGIRKNELRKDSFCDIKENTDDLNDHEEIKTFFNAFFNDFNRNSDEYIEQYFTEDFLYLNVDEKVASNKLEMMSLHQIQKALWDKINVDKYVLIEKEKDSACIIAYGNTVKRQTNLHALENVQEEIKTIASLDISNQEKLFQIRLVVAKYFKDVSIGEDYIYPIRIHSLIKKINGRYKICYLQLSYPFHYILENKNVYMNKVK